MGNKTIGWGEGGGAVHKPVAHKESTLWQRPGHDTPCSSVGDVTDCADREAEGSGSPQTSENSVRSTSSLRSGNEADHAAL